MTRSPILRARLPFVPALALALATTLVLTAPSGSRVAADPPTAEAAELLRLIAPRSGESIADVGCGKGTWTFHLAQAVGPQGRVTAVDVDARVLEVVRERIAREGWDQVQVLRSLPDDPGLGGQAYDAVLLNDVIDHVERGALAGFLAGLRAALKSDGRLVIRDPNGGADRVIAECHRAGFALVEGLVPLPNPPPGSFAGGWYALKLRRAEPQHAILPRLGQPARHRTRLFLAEELFRAGLIERAELRATWERIAQRPPEGEAGEAEALDLLRAAQALEILPEERLAELRARASAR
jgi:SAM-dependent methyltransferase